jgi:hypothetical protein
MVLPNSTFLGIDSAPGAIARCAGLGLANLTLTTGTIEDFTLLDGLDASLESLAQLALILRE